MDPQVDLGLAFVMVGTKGAYGCGVLETFGEGGEVTLDYQFVEVDDELAAVDFVSAAYTPVLPKPYGCALCIIGTSEGGIVAINSKTGEFIERGNRRIINGEIGHISVKNG